MPRSGAQRYRFWDDRKDAALRKMWAEYSVKTIAERVGTSQGAVSNRAKDLGLPPRGPKKVFSYG